jgi:hypothetical protein
MWMQENGYNHNIRARVERKAKIYLSSINAERKLPKYSAEYTRGYKNGWRDCCKDIIEWLKDWVLTNTN